MSSTKTQILFLGATGYLGGAVLERLLKHSGANNSDITALVRSPAKAKILEDKFGVRTVPGTIAEHDKVAQLAEKADIVFSIVDADDVTFISALLRGLKARKVKTGVAPILIHTSGTAILNDEAKGAHASDKIYHDSRPEDIESVPDNALHRPVDLAIVKADSEGSVRSYIIVPPTIYGAPTGEFFDAGVRNAHSIQIPALIKSGIARGQTGVVGSGKPIWNNAHVDDVADLYIVLYGALLKDASAVPHGRAGFFIAENGEHTWAELSAAVARALFELGANASPEPRPFAREELPTYFGSEAFGYVGFGANARGRGEQARALGWAPKYTEKDLYASIKPEAQSLLQEVKA
ncbi:NAD-P-binding protein [Trametes elegans]|nr:NAD-P-binding protein [Trametes elegans]